MSLNYATNVAADIANLTMTGPNGRILRIGETPAQTPQLGCSKNVESSPDSVMIAQRSVAHKDLWRRRQRQQQQQQQQQQRERDLL